jgi:hypothetical protein
VAIVNAPPRSKNRSKIRRISKSLGVGGPAVTSTSNSPIPNGAINASRRRIVRKSGFGWGRGERLSR